MAITTEERGQEIIERLLRMNPRHRMYWCESKACGCLGCVNRCGPNRLGGVCSKEEWLEVMRAHPELHDRERKLIV